jgi:hypothetical protein
VASVNAFVTVGLVIISSSCLLSWQHLCYESPLCFCFKLYPFPLLNKWTTCVCSLFHRVPGLFFLTMPQMGTGSLHKLQCSLHRLCKPAPSSKVLAVSITVLLERSILPFCSGQKVTVLSCFIPLSAKNSFTFLLQNPVPLPVRIHFNFSPVSVPTQSEFLEAF